MANPNDQTPAKGQTAKDAEHPPRAETLAEAPPTTGPAPEGQRHNATALREHAPDATDHAKQPSAPGPETQPPQAEALPRDPTRPALPGEAEAGARSTETTATTPPSAAAATDETTHKWNDAKSQPPGPEALDRAGQGPLAAAMAQERARAGGRFRAAVLSGLIAGLVAGAAAGALAAFVLLKAMPRVVSPNPGEAGSIRGAESGSERAAIVALRAELAALSERLSAAEAAFSARDADQEQAASASEAVEASLAELKEQLSELNSGLAHLRETEIPLALAQEAARLQQELEAKLRESLMRAVEAERARLENARAEAEALRRGAKQRAVLAALREAAETGAPAPAAVAELVALFGPAQTLPPAVFAFAQGLPTLAALRDEFAAAARAALAAQPVPEGVGFLDRLTGFLRAQLGMRSLRPREGNEPEAILARAEAALQEGDLARALAELDSLPPAGLEAMASWRAKAEQRLAALALIARLEEAAAE